MSELITGIFSAPIATLFVVAGMVFLLIAVVEIYDRAEKKIASDVGLGDVPATLSFESEVGATYYAVVKPFQYRDRGDYELVVREE